MKLTTLDGTTWTRRTARHGLPILVEYVRHRREITYGQWDGEIVRRKLGEHVLLVQYGYPAGAIGDACEAFAKKVGEYVPAINLMIINQKTRMPGKGANPYIRRFCRQYLERDVNPANLNDREKRAIIERALVEIFDYPRWDEMLRALGLTVPKRARLSGVVRSRRKPNPANWARGAESEAHKNLKHLIAGDPSMVGLRTEEFGKTEHLLWSGDRVDVHFQAAALAVEVKTSMAGYDELHRGIHQCVKYKALLRAQQLEERQVPTADCVLAVGGLVSEGLREIAETHGVRVYDRLGK